MQIRKLAFVVGAMLSFALISCRESTSSNNTNVQVLHSIHMKAGIVYKFGGAQPAARVTFYLLDDNLQTILRKLDWLRDKDWAYTFGHNMTTSSSGFEANRQYINETIKPHIVQTGTTDFDGTAKFEGLRPGTYYLAGVAETRGDFVVWNVPVNISEAQTTVNIILDQNNAAYAE